MNLPNFLTLTRILLVPFFVIAVAYRHFSYAIAIFFVAGVTDGLDGLFARSLHQKTKLGAILDPLADKLLLTSAYITLGILHLIPFWLPVVVVSRDVIIALGILIIVIFGYSYEIRPRLISKATTVLQIVTVLAVLCAQFCAFLPHHLLALYVLTVVLTVISGVYYMYLGMKILNP
ncbi:MAG: CDP-diacylglycerol--glycerol-3-phosphate 3-phosphatidyltransferase [Deltaproteobacteria bacterium]|nr:MAG: CDP-diacylglycerol--glycerol-3-phosphate 3-phosphatidyltransferase [Deltaproteobacteria bacterium]